MLEIVYRRDSVKPQQQPQTETTKPRYPSTQLSSDNLRDMQQVANAVFNGNLTLSTGRWPHGWREAGTS